MQNEGSVEIDRPIDEVFLHTNACVAEWSIVVVENEVLEEKPEGVGTTFRTVTEDHGRRMEFQGVVTRHDPPHASAVRMIGKAFDIEAEYSFEDLSGRTRVTQRSSVSGKGPLQGDLPPLRPADAQDELRRPREGAREPQGLLRGAARSRGRLRPGSRASSGAGA